MPEACEALGLSEGAIRKRIARGTLRSEKDAEGRVLVVVDAATRREAAGQSAGQPGGQENPELVGALRDQIEYLRRQVEEEREARRRADIMLSRLMDRLPELEAPQEGRQEPQESPQRAPESPQRAPEGQDASGTRPGRQEPAGERPAAEAGQEARPWWRRIFGA